MTLIKGHDAFRYNAYSAMMPLIRSASMLAHRGAFYYGI